MCLCFWLEVNGSRPVLPYIPANSVFCTAYPECTTSLDQAVCGREMDDVDTWQKRMEGILYLFCWCIRMCVCVCLFPLRCIMEILFVRMRLHKWVKYRRWLLLCGTCVDAIVYRVSTAVIHVNVSVCFLPSNKVFFPCFNGAWMDAPCTLNIVCLCISCAHMEVCYVHNIVHRHPGRKVQECSVKCL